MAIGVWRGVGRKKWHFEGIKHMSHVDAEMTLTFIYRKELALMGAFHTSYLGVRYNKYEYDMARP